MHLSFSWSINCVAPRFSDLVRYSGHHHRLVRPAWWVPVTTLTISCCWEAAPPPKKKKFFLKMGRPQLMILVSDEIPSQEPAGVPSHTPQATPGMRPVELTVGRRHHRRLPALRHAHMCDVPEAALCKLWGPASPHLSLPLSLPFPLCAVPGQERCRLRLEKRPVLLSTETTCLGRHAFLENHPSRVCFK